MLISFTCALLLSAQGMAANLTKARAQLDAGHYEDASRFFEAASKGFAKNGDPNAAEIWHDQALRFHTEIRLFWEAPAPVGTQLARLEPANGCFIGANIERDDVARDPAEFNKKIGKNQAIFFIYQSYGNPFPTEFAKKLHRIGAGLQIAWEPRNLNLVGEDKFLHKYAEDLRKSDIPVFLRFASEMNGDWTPYHADPAAYKAAFRIMADLMHREAPNAATVWCPNTIPQANIDSYFPGDDAVDWVGVNFYSVIYNDGDRGRGAAWRNPADAVQYVYDRYSSRHPMMVGEWAATHRSVVDSVERPDFASDKIGQFYAALPRLYPRIKAVHWLSMNTEAHAEGERRLNDFCILDSLPVTQAYADAIKPEYFRSFVSRDSDLADVRAPLPVSPASAVKGEVKLSAWVRSYDQHPHVFYTIGGGPPIDGGSMVGTYEIPFDTTKFPDGPVVVKVTAMDERGRKAGEVSFPLMVANHPSSR